MEKFHKYILVSTKQGKVKQLVRHPRNINPVNNVLMMYLEND